MDRQLEGQLSWESAIRIVEKDLQVEFRESHSKETIEEVARESVIGLASESVRIRNYVAILAQRDARRRLKEMDRQAS
jgi:hypothetical protein